MKQLMTLIIMVFVTLQLHSQKQTVTGIVTDENNLPLPGVNVIVKNTHRGVSTNFDGEYSLKASVGDILEYTYIGYKTTTKTITANNISKSLNITLAEDFDTLDEVVITAQGVKRQKKALGYSVVTVESESISNSSRSVSSVLQGKSAGVQVTSANGVAGTGSNFIIRGYSNMSGIPTTQTESYATINENIFKNVSTSPLSTFSIDVDKAGYSNVRRLLNNGSQVPSDAVKVEEMINYFRYNYPQPTGEHPFSITTEMAKSPWNTNTKLLRVGLKGRDIALENTPKSNLVFLLDVSGSMESPNKLPLLKKALEVLVDNLRQEDRVSIVVYAGAAGVVLKPTSGKNKNKILNAIDNLSAGGSTAGGQGIKLAYKLAEEQFIKNGNNRIILATDGDFNVGASSDKAMEKLIVEKRKTGIYLTCLGFGMGNYKDSKLETLADKGNGNHAYIDSMQEARKVLGTEFFGTIYTIAKDVKIQVEFNPTKVQAYRLIGYENRLLNDEDFNDDTKDAGELGSGHTVTALYEIIPFGVNSKYVKDIDALKYTSTNAEGFGDELVNVKFRYKEPNSDTSKFIEQAVIDSNIAMDKTSEDFKFAASVALFGMQLKGSKFIEEKDKEVAVALAEQGRGTDEEGYRAEFIRLVKSARLNK